jgi:hypothetical protein
MADFLDEAITRRMAETKALREAATQHVKDIKRIRKELRANLKKRHQLRRGLIKPRVQQADRLAKVPTFRRSSK